MACLQRTVLPVFTRLQSSTRAPARVMACAPCIRVGSTTSLHTGMYRLAPPHLPLLSFALGKGADAMKRVVGLSGGRVLRGRGRAVRVRAMEEEDRLEMVMAEMPAEQQEASFETSAPVTPVLPCTRAFVAGASGGVGSKLVEEVREPAGLWPSLLCCGLCC
jgi:hypothetical protein